MASKAKKISGRGKASGSTRATAGAGVSAGSAAAGAKSARSAASQSRRFWLMYPPRMIKNPVIWELGRKFKVITNVRQASVTDEIGIVCLELEAAPSEIRVAINWLEKQGISVEPVEINVIES